MNNLTTYISTLLHGIKSLLIGMKTSITVFFRKKTTEQYPENRATLTMFERFRGTLTMPHDEQNQNKCVACGICQMNCPNNTIHIETETITDEEGKKKKILKRYLYDLGSCTFCQLCVNTCPHNAITFENTFEYAVYTREKLIKQLNRTTTEKNKEENK